MPLRDVVALEPRLNCAERSYIQLLLPRVLSGATAAPALHADKNNSSVIDTLGISVLLAFLLDTTRAAHIWHARGNPHNPQPSQLDVQRESARQTKRERFK